MLPSGKLITFEGGEGCGKTTQINLAAKFLAGLKVSYLLTREPGGTVLGDKLRALFHDASFSQMSSLTELFLIQAARAEHLEKVIKAALKQGKLVLCDRYTDATIAYQGYARGLALAQVKELNSLASFGLQPSRTYFFDLAADKGLARARRRNQQAKQGKEERLEREQLSFHQRVREGYLALAKEEPQRITIIDADHSIEQVFARLKEELQKELP